MNLSTIECWETPHTTTDDNTFYSEVEPRWVYWDISPNETFDYNEPREISFALSRSCTPPPPSRQKGKLSMGLSFPKEGGVSRHNCEACGQPVPVKKKPQFSGKNKNSDTLDQTLN